MYGIDSGNGYVYGEDEFAPAKRDERLKEPSDGSEEESEKALDKFSAWRQNESSFKQGGA